jgi:multidrug resistance protein MdtO
VLVSSIVHLYLWPDSEARSSKRVWRSFIASWRRPSPRDDEVQLVPLFAALTESETLINRVAAEPLGTYAHPWPEAKNWPVRATFHQAEEILRLSEGYRLYAAPGDTFTRCARRLEGYAADIDAQQTATERPQALLRTRRIHLARRWSTRWPPCRRGHLRLPIFRDRQCNHD